MQQNGHRLYRCESAADVVVVVITTFPDCVDEDDDMKKEYVSKNMDGEQEQLHDLHTYGFPSSFSPVSSQTPRIFMGLVSSDAFNFFARIIVPT